MMVFDWLIHWLGVFHSNLSNSKGKGLCPEVREAWRGFCSISRLVWSLWCHCVSHQAYTPNGAVPTRRCRLIGSDRNDVGSVESSHFHCFLGAGIYRSGAPSAATDPQTFSISLHIGIVHFKNETIQSHCIIRLCSNWSAQKHRTSYLSLFPCVFPPLFSSYLMYSTSKFIRKCSKK